MAKLFEVVLGSDDGLYHLFLCDGRVLQEGYSTPEDAWKAWHEKYHDASKTHELVERAITEGENVVRFPLPNQYEEEK